MMQLPDEIMQQLAGNSRVKRIRSVTIFAADREDGSTGYICRGSAQEIVSESGLVLPSPRMGELQSHDVFFLITAYLQAILMAGSRPRGPQLEIAQGGAQLNV